MYLIQGNVLESFKRMKNQVHGFLGVMRYVIFTGYCSTPLTFSEYFQSNNVMGVKGLLAAGACNSLGPRVQYGGHSGPQNAI